MRCSSQRLLGAVIGETERYAVAATGSSTWRGAGGVMAGAVPHTRSVGSWTADVDELTGMKSIRRSTLGPK